MALQFGTDGVRGVGQHRADAGAHASPSVVPRRGCWPGRVVVGRDTRRSGPLLEAALAAGFAAEGVDVELLGVVPDPGGRPRGRGRGDGRRR